MKSMLLLVFCFLLALFCSCAQDDDFSENEISSTLQKSDIAPGSCYVSVENYTDYKLIEVLIVRVSNNTVTDHGNVENGRIGHYFAERGKHNVYMKFAINGAPYIRFVAGFTCRRGEDKFYSVS